MSIQGAQVVDASDFLKSLDKANETASTLKDGISETDRVAALKAAQKLTESLEKPAEAVIKMGFSLVPITCVRLGIDMRLFATLEQRGEPVSSEDLAAVKSADIVLVERVLRVLTGIGYIAECGPKLYAANDMTREMASPAGADVIISLFDSGSLPFAKTPEYFRGTKFQINPETSNGPLQYAEKRKESMWQLLLERPELSRSFNTFMEKGRGARTSWVDWYPVQENLLDGAKNVFDPACEDDYVIFVDVAGGRGHELQAFQAKFPRAPGRLVLEDQGHVLDDAGTQPGSKIERLPFDLFEEQPIKGARIYYMKYIMHDWSDADCRTILGHIRDASTHGYSKLIIEDFIMPDTDAPLLATLWDLEMLIYLNSMERTKSQWTALLSSAGFDVLNISTPPHDGTGIIEAEISG